MTNNLLKDNKELMKEYNYVKNKNFDLDSITLGMDKKIWWICNKGHEWDDSPGHRSKGRKCPICSNFRVLKGYNDLATTNPELAKEWNYKKNYPLKPEEVIAGSSKKVWWICKKGHEWEVSLSHRKKGSGCPYCSNQKVLAGYNDLVTTNPELAKEWNYEKNYPITPDQVVAGSNKKVWWVCEKGHEWKQAPNIRTTGCGCPYCAGQKILVGFNDLATTNPRLAKEWNYEKNKFGPESVMEHSNKKVWWKCDKEHEWQADINSRGSGSNCPICSKELKTSFPEKTIYLYIKKIYDDTIENYRDISIENKEIDIYIPSKKIGIEYDGDYWHNDEERDIQKDIICKNNGIKIYRIREPKCKNLKSSTCIILKNRSIMELEKKIKYLINDLLKQDIDIDISRDKNQVYELMNYQERENSLSKKAPNLIEEWDYQRNYPLLPSQVSYGSNKKVWWICAKCGYNWETKISHRFAGSNCPRCPNSIEIIQYDLEMNVLKIYNSIANAERETGIRNIKEALSGGRKTAGGYIWKYKNEEEIMKKLSNQVYHNSKKIIQYDLQMNMLKEYSSIAAAERENRICHIKDVLSGKRKTAGGYIWRYFEDKE